MTGWTEIGDRIWTRRYDFADETVGVIEGETGLVLIDTRASEISGHELRAQLRDLSSSPLVAVVNTHGHWDHVWGNACFTDVPIWAHHRAPDFVRDASEPLRQNLLQRDLTPDERAAITAVTVTPPTDVMNDVKRLDLGDRVVSLTHLGRGHTDHDIVVTCSDADACFVGDLVKESGPPGFRDSFPHEWAQTLDRLMPLLTGPVVVGHGRVVDRAFAAQFRTTIARVSETLRLLVEGHLDDDAAVSRAGVHPRAFQQARARVGLPGDAPAGPL
ncbi:MBL fold metallo-hydrolase [Luteipulveratus mongoliensis]|uniref:MBL fold metallo-hydrolase n=1 Tax=Luteipulveratus mongoliensis TaxID=571913 RepID=UPI00069857A7|nr:MBL fold metallo-hydrolase [Luteipulveratus mongoliensis]